MNVKQSLARGDAYFLYLLALIFFKAPEYYNTVYILSTHSTASISAAISTAEKLWTKENVASTVRFDVLSFVH